MSWTTEKEIKLKELWKKGHTASKIAEILGDTTRNAVIGKAHRLSLQARAASKKPLANLFSPINKPKGTPKIIPITNPNNTLKKESQI